MLARETAQNQEIDPARSPLEYLWNITPFWNRRYKIRSDFNIHISKLPIKGVSPGTVFVTFYSYDMGIEKIWEIMWKGEQRPAETQQVTKEGARVTTLSDEFITPVIEEHDYRHYRRLLEGNVNEQEEKQQMAMLLACYIQEQLKSAGDSTMSRNRYSSQTGNSANHSLNSSSQTVDKQYRNLIDILGFDPGGDYKTQQK